jgi:hypothetical protein
MLRELTKRACACVSFLKERVSYAGVKIKKISAHKNQNANKKNKCIPGSTFWRHNCLYI